MQQRISPVERNPDKPEVLKTVRNVGYVYVPTAA